MAKILILQADYSCPPIWSSEEADYLDPEDLPISTALRVQINEWADQCNQNYSQADHTKTGFKSEVDRRQFHQRGEQLAQVMQVELESLGYQVKYER